jgi:antirestriction protein
MTTSILYAQPYDISAKGFYFHNREEFDTKVESLVNDFGSPVEEFEIQFIDGETIDYELANAIELSQCNFPQFFALADDLEEFEKINFIISVRECGYEVKTVLDDIDSLDITIYEEDSFADLARQFVDEGLYGEIPESLQFYIDYEAIGRDLAIEFGEARINGRSLIYRCG